MENQRGFFTLGVIIAIAVVAIISGGTAYYFIAPKTNIRTPVNNNYVEPVQTITTNNIVSNNQTVNNTVGQIVGGACSYYSIPGKCKITSVAKTEESKQQSSSIGYEGYSVKFSFTVNSSTEVPSSASKLLASVKFPRSLQLANSWYFGPLYLEKYGIKTDSVFDCQALAIYKGTCTPVSFKFSGIDLADYFEVKN